MLALDEYFKSRTDDSEYIFVSERKPYNKCTKASIEKMIHRIQSRTGNKIHVTITPHIIRHTSATMALESGMPVQDIQLFLGHSSIETTMKYAHVNMFDVADQHRRHVI